MQKHLLIIILLSLLLSIFSVSYATTVTIGTDLAGWTNFLPVFVAYQYSYTQQIYTQTQIDFAGDITTIRFFYIEGDITSSMNWTIYLGHTQKTEFTSTTDWEAFNNLTQVFTGDVSAMLPAPNNWLEITLNAPFHYNNVDNLIVAVRQQNSSSINTYWRGFNSECYRSIYYYNDSTNPNPSNPPTANNRSKYNSRVQFVFTDTTPPMAPLLISPENGANMVEGQSLSWSLPNRSADATGYDVYVDDSLVSQNQSGTSYPPTSISQGWHNWRVVAHNDYGTSASSMTGTFETVCGTVIGTETLTTYSPFSAYRGYTRSLGLYTFDQIGTFGVITTLGWHVHRAGLADIPYKIYAKITDATAHSAMTWSQFKDGVTLVKEGNHTFDSEGWHEFALDTPFSYTHGNLLIGVETNYGGTGAPSVRLPIFHRSVSTSNTHQYWSQDNSPPTGNGTLNTRLPNLLVMLLPLSDEPMLALSPSGWNFGRVQINNSDHKVFTAINTGSETVTITSFSPMLDNFYEVTGAPTFPVTLAPGDNTNITIKYAPTATGNHTATFSIDAGNSTTAVVVSGECYDPTIYDFPWLEEFTDTSFPPAEWARYRGLYGSETPTRYSGGWYRAANFANISDPANPCARINIGGLNTKHWLVTPPIAIPNGVHVLDFDLALTKWGNSNPVDPAQQQDDKFMVLTADNPSMTNATVLREWNNTGSPCIYDNIANLGETIIIDLSSHVGTNYIAFYGESTVSNKENQLFVDNVCVREITLPQVITQFSPHQLIWNTVDQSIDLDDYFSGPDLTYSVLGNSMISASVLPENILSLAPVTDWYGTEYITIRATNLAGYVEQVLKVTAIKTWQITEDFNHGGSTPSNWATSHAGTTDFPWQPVLIDGDDYAMKTMATTGGTAYERLFSPNYDLNSYQDIVVSFDTDFLPYGNGSGTFAYTLNNVTYTVVETFDAETSGRKSYTIPNLDAKPSVKFRWIYANSSANTGQDNHWIVDNFCIYGIVRDIHAPSAVEDFNLVSQTPSSTTLSWQASSDLYFGRYELYVSTDDQVTTTDQLWSIEHDPALAHEATTQTTITGLATGDYWISIRAVDLSSNASPLSEPVFAHLDSEAPVISDPVPGMQPEPIWAISRTVEIGCSISDSGLIPPYNLYYRIDANGNGSYDDDEVWTAVPPQTGRQIRNRDELTLFFEVSCETDGVFAFEFKATDLSGNTGYSGLNSQEGIDDDWVIRIDTLPPADINNFFAEEVTENSVQLTWAASADINFVGYRIHYSTTTDVDTDSPYWDWSHDPNLSQAGTGLVSTVISDLDPATRYYFLLLAIDEAGWTTEYPQVITAMTTSSAEPKTPENLSVSIVDGLLILDWDDVTEDVLGNPIVPSYYAVYVGDHPYFTCNFDSLIATVNESYLELADVVEYADRLFFKVIAVTGMIRKAK